MILDLFKSKSGPAPNLPFPRCQHRSPSGRQCSQPICSASPQFCFTHKPKPEELLIAELTEAAGSLSTPEEIHNFLTKVTLLRVQGRLTPKEACAYAYLCQILQRGQREIAFHQKLRDDRAQLAAAQAQRDEVDSWSIPRPGCREDDPVVSVPESPSSATASVEVPTSRRSLSEGGTSAPRLATADSTIDVSPPAQPVSAGTPAQPVPSTRTSYLSPDFYNHFFPIDPNLPPGLQDPRKNIPPPDEAECRRLAARRGLLFNRRRPNLRGTPP